MSAQLGFALALLSGVMAGSFSLPMKRMTHWAWENTWMMWSLTAMLLLPWGIALCTVPNLGAVYAGSGVGVLAMVYLFGVLWGAGALLFGQGIALVGMSLAFAINVGLATALGALVPMARKPEIFLTRGGTIVAAGVLVMMLGVGICAKAGMMRDARLKTPGQQEGASTRLVAKGLIICILAGIFSSMINFAFNFGDRILAVAGELGTPRAVAADAVWAVTLLGGFTTNALYCGRLLTRNGTWARYGAPASAGHWPLALCMGLLWLLSVTFYGRAAAMMGTLGGSAGWAIYMGCCILVANLWGMMTGEWKQGRGAPLKVMYAGQLILLLAIALIGYGNGLIQ